LYLIRRRSPIGDSGTGTSTTIDGFLIDPKTGALTKMAASSLFLANVR
jgi:hypothetical protein